MAVQRGHIDSVAIWRMLLKRRERRLNRQFGHPRLQYGHAEQWVRLPASRLRSLIKHVAYMYTHAYDGIIKKHKVYHNEQH